MSKSFGTITMVRIEELDAEAPTSALYGVWNTVQGAEQSSP